MERPDTFRFNPHAPLAQGLVFAGLGQRGPDRTSHYQDSSLYGISGRLVNLDAVTDTLWEPSLGRWLMSPTADGEYIEIPTTSPVCAVGLSWTLAAWVKPVTLQTSAGIWSQWQATNNYRAYSWYTSSAGDMRLYLSTDGVTTSTKTLAANGSLANGVLAHIAITFDNGVATAFVNGVASASQTYAFSSVFPGVGTSKIAGSYATTRTIGRIGDTLGWLRPLSLPEIEELADPSNTMLGGLLLNPRRVMFPAVVAPPQEGGGLTGKRTFYAHTFRAWTFRCGTLRGTGGLRGPWKVQAGDFVVSGAVDAAFVCGGPIEADFAVGGAVAGY
jgi:hypothetical protein